jgi:beta-N-acetylhexosaminidase
VTDLLRGKIGFGGIILTDDLEMGAVNQRLSAGEVTLAALGAGNDCVMYCKSWERIEAAHDAILRALESGALERARIESSLSRILALKRRPPFPGAAEAFEPEEFEEVCQGLKDLAGSIEG